MKIINKSTSSKGYTLIEVLMVIALLSILLAIAIPNMGFYRRIGENQEIRELKKDMLFARNRAIAENRIYFVHFVPSINSYEIRREAFGPIVKSKTLGKGLLIEDREIGRPIGFTPNGTTIDSGTIYIKSSRGQRYVLTVTPATGRIGIRLE